jgi:hypothetical protein
LLRRAARAARAEQQAERPDTGWLDSFTQMGAAIYSSNDELLVPGRIQQDPAAVADNGAAAMQYGHIVVTFDVALLRQEIKELQEGISNRKQRAPPEHRGLYDVLEENLVAGNKELEDDMDFFTTSERKE